MNKIIKYLKREIVCLNGRTDRDMVNFNQYSPRVTRSKSKKQQKPEEINKPDEEEAKNRKKKFRDNSVKATRGSVASISLLQTPKACDGSLSKGHQGWLSPMELNPPEDSLYVKSPPIATISTDTPERSKGFHKEIENVAKCRLRILGKGSFGTIIQATYKGELVAAKIVPPNKSNSLKNELNNFLLSHPNIVKTLRIISNEENQSCGLVIMEMCSSFTMEHLSNEESFNLDEKSVVRYMTDIAYALDYCHNHRVLHLDVKPQNILVNITTKVCKLCDFGSSCLVTSDEGFEENTDYKILQSTLVYTSPELLTGGLPTPKSDIYSFGITLWQLINREKPYVVDNKIDLQSTIYKIVKQKKRPQKKLKKNGPLEKLYMRCWEHEPEKRPTMQEIVTNLQIIP